MHMKPLELSHHLKVNRHLKHRIRFSEKEWSYYLNDEKGFIGEQFFEKRLLELPDSKFIIISDLLLQWNNTIIQIDSLAISSNKIFPHEIKNYEGDYYTENERLYSMSGKEMKNPFHQLSRIENALRDCLHSSLKLPLKSNIVFTNPEFTMYDSTKNLPIIFPTQINRYINKLTSTSSSSSITKGHIEIAQKLLSLHTVNSPYEKIKIPSYSYDSIKKGLYCKFCSSFALKQSTKTNFTCSQCGQIEKIETGLTRVIEEISLLFPELNISTPLIKEWCNIGQLSSKTIRSVLSKKFDKVTNHPSKIHYFTITKTEEDC